MSEHRQDQKTRTGMSPEETELWIELMEKGLAIQNAVPGAAAGAGGRGGTIPE